MARAQNARLKAATVAGVYGKVTGCVLAEASAYVVINSLQAVRGRRDILYIDRSIAAGFGSEMVTFGPPCPFPNPFSHDRLFPSPHCRL